MLLIICNYIVYGYIVDTIWSKNKLQRKCDIKSTLLQKEQMLTDFILLFFNHSLQASVLCIILIWKICIALHLVHKKGILKIVFQKLSSLFLKFV